MLILGFPPLDDQRIAGFILPSFKPLGRDPPGSNRMAAAGAFPLAAAVGMIHRIHGHAAYPGRRPSQRALPALRWSGSHVQVPGLTDGRPTG